MVTRDKFKKLREKKGYSQLKLAKESGLSNGMICRFERGGNDITLKNLELLLETMGTDELELFEPEKTTIDLLSPVDATEVIGTIERTGHYNACVALIVFGSPHVPDSSTAIISRAVRPVDGDLIAYADKDNRLHFERYRSETGVHYFGVVIECEWSFTR